MAEDVGTIVNGKQVNEPTKSSLVTTATTVGATISMEQMRKKFPLPKRPGFGAQGSKIQLKANFFPIKIPDKVSRVSCVGISS